MSQPKVIFGFHAVGVRLKTAPQSMLEVLVDGSRRDARMRQFMARAWPSLRAQWVTKVWPRA
jgi:23S rRNA (guanosine2251-2'-O)-methyltransferase